MGYLRDEKVVERHEKTFGGGYDHLYPNESLVRLVKWFFPDKQGRVLDFGFGPGANLIHLLRVGYETYGIDVSENAKHITERKVIHYRTLNENAKADLKILGPNDEKLPYPDEFFNYIVSNQTVYFLFDEDKIINLLNDFKRILKPGGRFIITMMSQYHSAAILGVQVSHNQYEYTTSHSTTTKEEPNRVYITQDEAHCRRLFSMFKIHEVGFFDFKYCGENGHHWVVLGEKTKD